MEDGGGRYPAWLLADGSASISVAAFVAVLIYNSAFLAGVWGIGYLHELTINRQDGLVIVASLALFPSTLFVYGVASMIFAAKEAVERRARRKGREEGRQEGREEGRQEGLREERDRIERELAALEDRDVEITPEMVRSIVRKSGPRS